MILEIIVSTLEMIFEILVMLSAMFLYLTPRWDRRHTFWGGLILGGSLVYAAALIPYVFLRMAATSLTVLAVVLVIFTDSFLKKLLVFLMFYNVVLFSEAVAFNVLRQQLPRLDQLMYENKESFGSKLIDFSLDRVAIAVTTYLLAGGIFYLLSRVIRQKDLDIRGRRAVPFILMAFLQTGVSLMMTFLISTFVKGYFSPFLLLFEHTLMISILTWLLRQVFVTTRRLRAEKELENVKYIAELDLEYYENLREKIVMNDKFRHDFNNQIQIIQAMMERDDAESIKQAGKLIRELLAISAGTAIL